MKVSLLCISISLTLLACSNTYNLTLKVETPPGFPDTDTLFVTGNHDLLGNWDPDALPMKRIDANHWKIELKFDSASNLEYKFTRGSWDTEEITGGGGIPGNKILSLKTSQTLNHKIADWKDIGYTLMREITGDARYHESFYSPHLNNERDLIVLLPKSYDSDTTIRYPVLYMHDGQNVFDPNTSTMQKDWRVDEEVERLFAEGQMQEVIVVAVNNSSDRLTEYNPFIDGEEYAKFIVVTLKPFIDATYRTLTDRENTGIMGSSMGGLISLYMILEYQNIFSKAGCLSTSLLFAGTDIFDWVSSKEISEKPLKIYFDYSGQGEEGRRAPYFEKMRDILLSKGLIPDEDLYYFVDPDGRHNEESWAARVWRPLTFLFPAIKKD